MAKYKTANVSQCFYPWPTQTNESFSNYKPLSFSINVSFVETYPYRQVAAPGGYAKIAVRLIVVQKWDEFAPETCDFCLIAAAREERMQSQPGLDRYKK
ncbi:MAG: hypothetical protein CL608_16845 [Anaerolineaceae bacterium]|nr:hypothetical protein [Anaerolineaceae bacterium]